MGKIHKALEKSKIERQQSQKNPYKSLKTQLKGKRRPKKVLTQDRNQNNRQPTVDSNLGAIHNLLNDGVKVEPTKNGTKSLLETGKTHGEKGSYLLEQGHDKRNETKQERKIGTKLTTEERYEFPAAKNQEIHSRPDNGLAAESTIQDVQGENTQKIVSLKSSQISENKVHHIREEDYAKPTEGNETKYFRERTSAPARMHYSLVTLGKPKSFEAEQFKILRANLLFPKTGKPPKTILLTSAVPGEGKTFTAMNLAVSLAQNINSYVLLVDADIRKPEIHKRFGLGDNIYGLSDFLTQNMPIPSLLVKTPLSNLTILPGGQATINPSELISSDKMKTLLDELSTRYSDRFVIIDAPPPKLAAETYALSRFVEHIIPVVRAGRSNRDLVDEMMNLLGRDKIQGVVLNCYDIRDTKRFGYHKYSEYYSK